MKPQKYIIIIFCCLLICSLVQANQSQQPPFEIPLYDAANIPNSVALSTKEIHRYDPQVDSLVSNVSQPTLTIHLPSSLRANGTAVVICPGGGYQTLLINREGNDVAEAFNRAGVAAFVVKYRLPSDTYMKDRTIGSLQDAQRAIQLVRERSKQWAVDPAKIGIMGFSAGGHLAATAGTHFKKPLIDNSKNVNLRPDFMILVNPVISFNDSIGHTGSRSNLLGLSPSIEKIRFFSNELWVDKDCPPTFLVHANNDRVVPLANSLQFFQALKKNSVSAELHVYAEGDHGFLNNTPSFEEWFGNCLYWMKSKALIY
jgi:acetyl esterase/lipase